MWDQEDQISLKGKLLIAMPGMADHRFSGAVIYICAHSEEGAMGLVINCVAHHINFENLLEMLEIKVPTDGGKIGVQSGGPVETSRGFVLHSNDYTSDSTMAVTQNIGLTASVEILQAIASGNGPERMIVALGYTGWGPGQLDDEIQKNAWLHAPANTEVLFSKDLDSKWQRAVDMLGISISRLSAEAGHA